MSRIAEMSKKKAWIVFLISLIVCVAIILIVGFISNTTFGMILMVISFLLSSVFLQIALGKTFKVKKKEEPVVTNYYTCNISEVVSRLRAEKFNSRKTSYGTAFIKVDDKQAYKFIIIDNCDNYINQAESDKSSKTVSGLNDCETFIGIEFFLDLNETVSKRIKDYSFQNEKIYYQALYALNDEENYIVETNYLVPLEQHLKAYEVAHDLLGLEKTNINEE